MSAHLAPLQTLPAVKTSGKGRRRAERSWLKEVGLTRDAWPRHEPALRFIQGFVHDFKWSVDEGVGSNGKPYKHLKFENYPTLQGVQPTIAQLVRHLNRSKIDGYGVSVDRFPAQVMTKFHPVLREGLYGYRFVEALLKLDSILPEPVIARAVANWLSKSMKDEQSTILINVCPDYAHRDGKYTFEGLNDGIGLVAQKALSVLPILHQFISNNKLNIKLVIGMADTEGLNPANLQSVHLTQEAFMTKCVKSLQAIGAAAPAEIGLQTMMINQELPQWRRLAKKAKTQIAKGNWTGVYPLSASALEKIKRNRASIYKRWYGEGVNIDEVLAEQAAEYMAICAAAEQKYGNVLFLGVDSPHMSVFLQGMSDTTRPVLYIKQADY